MIGLLVALDEQLEAFAGGRSRALRVAILEALARPLLPELSSRGERFAPGTSSGYPRGERLRPHTGLRHAIAPPAQPPWQRSTTAADHTRPRWLRSRNWRETIEVSLEQRARPMADLGVVWPMRRHPSTDTNWGCSD